MKKIPIIEIHDFQVEQLERGKVHRFWVEILADELGNPIVIPVMVARGATAGHVVGVTAAVHGDELNGIPVIQRLFREIDVNQLRGTIVGVPVVNVLSYGNKSRLFESETDLNRIMPGKEQGNTAEIYAYRFLHEIVSQFEYLLDLHTASFGRVNSYYIRANMENEITAKMAYLQNADIIVNNPPSDHTLRGAAEELGIHAITLEVGNPNVFQKGMIRSGLTGIFNTLVHFDMIDGDIEEPEKPAIYCHKSYWMYTDKGGILRVLPNITDSVKKGDLIATKHTIFGENVHEYFAPESGVVIGKSISPVNKTGGRILHLGIIDQ